MVYKIQNFNSLCGDQVKTVDVVTKVKKVSSHQQRSKYMMKSCSEPDFRNWAVVIITQLPLVLREGFIPGAVASLGNLVIAIPIIDSFQL